MKRLLPIATMALCFALPLAAEPVGMVKTVRGAASIERGGKIQTIKPGDAVESRDRVITARDSSVGIALHDDTLIAAGPASVLAIDSFAFDSTTHEGGMALSIVKGTLMYISGLIARQNKHAVSLSTPTATIGIRGTEFIVEVPDHD